MAKVIEPLRQSDKLYDVISKEGVKRVLCFFWHGLGDLLMFLKPLEAIRAKFPDVKIDLGIVKGIGQEEIVPEALGFTTDKDLDKLDYDIVAKIHFPMSEHQQDFTKGEYCCIHELGIEPVAGHSIGACQSPNRLIAVHFNITCLPATANPAPEVAEAIWNEILECGFIPIETHFQHTFHNPENKKFDFVDCTVRRVKPRVSTLTGLLAASVAFIGVVSGPFHTALSVLPPEKICLLEKDLKLRCFTKKDIKTIDIKNYKNGSVKEWLAHIF